MASCSFRRGLILFNLKKLTAISQNNAAFSTTARILGKWCIKFHKNYKIMLKFIHSEKATNVRKSTVYLSYVVTVKSTVEISKKILAFSECMNFNITQNHIR